MLSRTRALSPMNENRADAQISARNSDSDSAAWRNLNLIILQDFENYFVNDVLLELDKLELLNQQARHLREHLREESSLELANMFFGLAVLNFEHKQFAEAAEFTEMAVHIRRHVLGESHRDLIHDLEVLAKSYVHIKNFNQAEDVALTWLRIAEDVNGEYEVYNAQIYTLLAQVYRAQSRNLEAEQQYMRAIQIHEANDCLDCMDVAKIRVDYMDYLRRNTRARSWKLPGAELDL